MNPASSGLQITDHDGVSRIDFIERNILDEANIQQIGDAIGAVVEASPRPRLLICFENVEHLSSAALGALITVDSKVKARDGQLRLSNIRPQILEVFRITRLDRLFEIHGTAEEAMGTFG
jgi:anti-sigma B factor antagonist